MFRIPWLLLVFLLACLPSASSDRPIVKGQKPAADRSGQDDGAKEEGQCIDGNCMNHDAQHEDGSSGKEGLAAKDEEDGARFIPPRLVPESSFPEGWRSYTYMDIREHFDCGYHSGDTNKALPSLEHWRFLQQTYTEIVDPTKKWNDPVPPTLGYSLEPGIPVPPPYYPKFTPGEGRGLFASRDIQRGEVVHDGTHSDVIFPSADAWRRYVFSLPKSMACDCTDWHWMQRMDDNEGVAYVMVGGINVSSLMNSGGDEYSDGRTPNALPGSGSSHAFRATRDIAKGEEVLTDYYVYETDFSKIGL
ncbi:hypothetical protein ACHAXT_011472 [Thalassiosira profunda]